VTETSESAAPAKKRSGGLSSMLLADLKAMAGGMGIPGAGSMRKAQLVEAIKAAQSTRATEPAPARSGKPAAQQPVEESAQPTEQSAQKPAEGATDKPKRQRKPRQQAGQGDQGQRDQAESKQKAEAKPESKGDGRQKQQDQKQQDQKQRQQGGQQQGQQQGGQQQGSQQQGGQQGGQQNDRDDEDGDGSRRNRRRRGRDRNRGQRNEPDTTILEDDILVPAAGILDVLDNYAFVRTTGYLPGADDVYVSLSMVKRLGLRPGDAVVGQVRHPREGERKEKFNPMVRIDSVNGADPEGAKSRAEFDKLVPLFPDERLRMEVSTGGERSDRRPTDGTGVTGRLVDLAAPIGKGQRGLIVAPESSGKTTLLQELSAAIATNNPECHLMVVLVDERPEEVTDFQRSVKGEVISSTFDRAPGDHTAIAELAVERAKRLVELGHDVVVLLDGITRLGRAYNLAMPASGRVLAGGVDSGALYPPKRFFGAARNIEDGGSLTILATATADSGSKVDELILEEFRGTANSELRLSRELAERQLFPAVDVARSGTRREERLLSPQEQQIVAKLRQQQSAGDPADAHERLLGELAASRTNIEFLTRFSQR